MKTIHTTTLYFQEGSSDKMYQAWLDESSAGKYVVNFAYGRRGSAMKTGTKTPKPVALEAASEIYDKLVESKRAKGYTEGEDGTPYQGGSNENKVSGILPQLLNAIDEDELNRLLDDCDIWMQHKHDGKRMLVHVKSATEAVAINRRGLEIGAPKHILEAVTFLARDQQAIFDGELVGNIYHIFDLLYADGTDMRWMPLSERLTALNHLFESACRGGLHSDVREIETAIGFLDKKAMLKDVEKAGGEGVVFKSRLAPYRPGRPASGGSQLKFKFVETASVIVGESRRGKRSVSMLLADANGQLVSAGNVTIPPNHVIPEAGTVVDVRYLYAMPESNALYQPVYLGYREDIPAEDCTLEQLKYKPKD